MYNAYFRFQTRPFNLLAEPHFFYDTPLAREAYISLSFAIQQKRRLLLLTGSSGTGKTTVLRRVAFRFALQRPVFYLPRCPHTFEDLLGSRGLELTDQPANEPSAPTLGEFLTRSHGAKETAILFLDDAHEFSPEALEGLNLLLNLETLRAPLLTLVLGGENSLVATLGHSQHTDLRKRIDLHLRLSGLSPAETASYIAHRLTVAGYSDPPQSLFTQEALQRITHYSKNIPRLVNWLCDNTLQAAHLLEVRQVSATLVDAVARDLALATGESVHPKSRHITLPPLPKETAAPARNNGPQYLVAVKYKTEPYTWFMVGVLVLWLSFLQIGQHSFFTQPTPETVATVWSPSSSQPSPSIGNDSSANAAQPLEQPRVLAVQETVPSPSPAVTTSHVQMARAQSFASAAEYAAEATSGPEFTRVSRTETAPKPRRRQRQPLSPDDEPRLQLARLGIAITEKSLLSSVEQGNEQIVHLLLAAGVSVNAKDQRGWTPLMFAARDNRGALVRSLIAHGAQVNAKNNVGGTPLIMAAMNNHPVVVETLLASGARINETSKQGWTALMYASWKGHRDVVETLLSNGADTRMRDQNGWTPLKYASWRQETRSEQEQLQREIATALGIDLDKEPLPVSTRGHYQEVKQLLAQATESH